VGRL
jgi:hypothetical protein